MKPKRMLVLVFTALAFALSARAGHDAITESMFGLLPERWQAFLKDGGHRATFRHDNHFPDVGKFSQLPDEDVAFFRAHGMTAVYPFHHGFPRAMAADRLVRAIKAGNDELALRYVGLLAHSLWDQKSLGHDTLFQYVNYMMTRHGGPGVVPDFPVHLSDRIAGTKSFKAAIAGYREQPVPADYTPMDMFAEVTGWKWTAMAGYARGEEFLRGFMLDVTDPKNPEGIEIVGREYGGYAVWALERLLLVVHAAQKFAAEGYDYPAFDAKAVNEMITRQDLEYGSRHDARVDVYAAPYFRKSGEEMKVAILYDPLEQWAAGFFDRISRVLNVQIAGSLREKRPDLKAALLDIRDFANEGLDPAKTPILVMGGRRTDRGYPACPWAKMLKSFNDYAARGGKIVWIDGLPPPSLDSGKIIPCHLEAKEKDHYANPAFVVSKENVPRSDMAWTGKDPEAWRFRRWCGSTKGQGWIWAGSRIYWDPKNLPAGSRAVLEYRTPAEFEPEMPVKVVGLVTPAEKPVFAYLPTNALFPYYLTDERPVLLPAPKWRLDSAGEKILFGILDLLNEKKAEPSGDFSLLTCGSGRVFTLGAAGDEKPLAVGCGNVHRAARFGGWTYYANGRLWRVPDGGGKAELVYGGVKHDNVYGFELRSDGTLVIACNAEERLLEFAAPGKDAKLPLERKDARLDFAVDTTSEDGKPTAAHTRLRMVRTTPAGTFLLGCGTSGMVREYDREGRLVWSHRAGGLVFEAVRLANGNTLVSNLKSLTEVTPDHRKVWSFTPADAPGEGLANLCSIYFLDDGTLLVGTYANGRPDGSRATAVIIDPRTKEVRWRHRPRTDRNMITISPLGPAAAPSQKPEGSVRIGFEDGAASGWKTAVGGPFPSAFTDRERQYGRNGGPTGKRGRFFLSTLEGWANNRRDHAMGVIESPTYRLAGQRVTFLIAGGKGAAFEAVDRLTGEVVASASGDGGQLLKEGAWDLSGSVGREIAFRVRDFSEKDFLLLDDICFEGAEVEDDFTLRTEEWDMPARVAAFRAEVKELGAAHLGYPAEAFLKEAEAFAVPRQEPGFAAARAHMARFNDLRLRALVRENPVVNGCEIAYVTYEQFKSEHHNTATIFQRGEINEAKYVTEGALRALDPKTGKVRDIVPRVAKRTVRDPEVDYDGRRIVLSARNGKDDDYHVYTVNADGSDYRQLTREKGVSDIDPAWLPDGDIVFSSTRNPKYCMCNRHIMCNLYRMKPDGANIHQIGVSTLFEGHSTVLADGRIMYDRWEYVDRNFGDAQGLWVCNQDGTRHAIYWGNNTGCPGGVINARQMPDGHVIAVLAACHDRPWGALGIIDRSKGVDGREPVLRTWPAWFRGQVARGGFDAPSAVQRRFADPFPLDARHFIAVRSLPDSEETELVYLDLNGNEFAFHADAPGIHSPVLLRPSARPPVHPVQRNFEHPNAKGAFLVQDVYVGTHMKGVERGTIKALRIVESPEKRNWTVPAGWYGQGQMAPGMNWHSFENKRILGTVPVEDDGSAYFELPANTFVYFQALDAEGKMVQSMRSGAYVQPGEIFSCVGCHENRVTQAPPPAKAVKALQRAPSKLDGAYNLRGLERGTPPHLYSFQREVQPVFTRSCVACHDYGKPAGEKLNLSGDLGAFFCTSYVDLWALKYVTCVGAGPASIRPPYSWGSHASKLTKALYGHGGVKLGDDDRDRVITWMDINAPYYPRYESAYPDNPGGRCPLTGRELRRLEALTGVKVSNSFATRQREQLDFARPELSRILLAPGAATNAAARAEALAIIAKGKERLAQTPRCDMDGFVPCPKDQEREAHYQRRLESERRAYESIREGRLTYDKAE